MLIVPDNDVIGAVAVLQLILESPVWKEYSEAVGLRFGNFQELGLSPDASDERVWQACQAADGLLVTGNRSGGQDSLEQAIEQYGDDRSLPVITIGNQRRVSRDRSYAEACAITLLERLERIDDLRGTGRLFIP